MKKIIGYILVAIAVLNLIGLLYLSSSNPSKLSNNSEYFTRKIITALIFGAIGIYLITAVKKKILTNVDYLLKSGVPNLNEALNNDKLTLYDEIISNNTSQSTAGATVDDSYLKEFLIKYKISLLKYSLNRDFLAQPFLHSNIEERLESKCIAPSLLKLINNKQLQIMMYPKWFYSSFPDVIVWATHNKGESIAEIFNSYEDKDLFKNKIKFELLTKIIDKYLRLHEDLECTINYKRS